MVEEWRPEVTSISIFIAVLPVIALPPSNAFVECIFSACTWFDDPLHQRLRPKRFKMAIFLDVNEILLLSEEIPTEDEVKQVVEKTTV